MPTVTVFASSGANVTGVGTIAWADTQNILISDNNYATAALTEADSVSNYLFASSFMIVVSGGARIDGITVNIERSEASVSAGSLSDFRVSLVKAGAIQSENKASATVWPTSDASASYGGTTDLWGTTWTVGQIQAAGFGVMLAVIKSNDANNETARVDRVGVSIAYATTFGISGRQSYTPSLCSLGAG